MRLASMYRTCRWCVVALVALGASAHAQSAPPAARALRESLLAQDRSVGAAVQRSGYAAGLAGALAPDAVLLLDAAPIAFGREAAARVLAARSDLAALSIECQPLVALVAPDGSLGITFGSTRARPSSGDSAFVLSNYVSAWRRQGDGWALVARVENGLGHEGAPLAVEVPGPARAIGGGATPFANADIAFARLALDSGAAAAFAAFAAPTAVTFGAAGELIMGPAAIRARLSEARPGARWVWAPVAGGASDDGELGFTVGESAISRTQGGATTTFYGHYLTAWRRMADGTVRFVADAGSSRPVPRPAP